WLGVEWDDPQRGKHDGTKDGIQYFTCTIPGSGSFIRPTVPMNTGKAFYDAFLEKYIDEPQKTQQQVESVILGSSNGAIRVEAPDLNKVRARLANLRGLREASLNGELVARSGDPSAYAGKLLTLRGLDLSHNLISNWEEISLIVEQLHNLQSLALNENRFRPLLNVLCVPAFSNVRELRLNRTFMTWNQFAMISPSFLQLLELQLGHNRLSNLSADSPILAPQLNTVHFSSNALHDWQSTIATARGLPNLKRLMLSGNAFKSIPAPKDSSEHFPELQHLAISDNQLTNWFDVNALAAWLPALSTLSCATNPVFQDLSSTSAAQLIIPRFPLLQKLDGTRISPAQRQDAELFYLSLVSREEFLSEQDRERAHPQWRALCEKHGAPAIVGPAEQGSKLGDKMIEVRLLILGKLPPDAADLTSSKITTLRVLKTMSMRVFFKRAAKALGMAAQKNIRLWLVIEGEQGVGAMELDSARDLEWCGVEDKSKIGVFAQ
ncbi:RNI-like protein, partial [Auriculariales sp. MPI-PUGE-AT-0066]